MANQRKARLGLRLLFGFNLLIGGVLVEVATVALMAGSPPIINSSFSARLTMVSTGAAMAVSGMIVMLRLLYKEVNGPEQGGSE